MPFLALSVDDEAGTTSLRAYLERNSIGLLTSDAPPIDPPSAEWIGNHSVEPLIRRSGMRYTPLRDAVPGRWTTRLEVEGRMERAGLPAPARELIRRVPRWT